MKNTKGLIIGILIVIVLVILIIMSGKKSAEQVAPAPTDTTVAPDETGAVPSTQNNGEQLPVQPVNTGGTNDSTGQSTEVDLAELDSIDSALQAIDVSPDTDLNSIDQETQ